jgi:hypothetical protein
MVEVTGALVKAHANVGRKKSTVAIAQTFFIGTIPPNRLVAIYSPWRVVDPFSGTARKAHPIDARHARHRNLDAGLGVRGVQNPTAGRGLTEAAA